MEPGGLHKNDKSDIFLIDYEIYKANPNWWLEIIEIFLKPGIKFKASFEKEQVNMLEKITSYENNLKISDEKNLLRVEGITNKKMIRDFKAIYKVVSGGGIDYYSPFNGIEIGEGYSSAHHGSELYLSNLSEDELEKIYKIINPLDQYLKFDIS